ncbi:unnamed protein product [Microthlaspi erraticum]|uniref:Uncharacterized protein n=1 Tax=Microthlaspi erraticum TaxID=1685480 RepID=A0A6D2JK96_9BRAS|nr:unnamed protein product [Microthlaspi erraticum]
MSLIRLLSSSFYSSRISYDPPPRISPRAANDPVPTWSLIELELVFTSTGIARMAVNWLTRESLGGLEVFLLGLSGPGLQSWIKIEESEEPVRLRSVWDPQRVTSSARRMQAVKICCFDFEFLQNLLQPLFPPSLLRLSCLRRIVKQEKGKAVDLGGDGKFTPHAETTLDAESLDTSGRISGSRMDRTRSPAEGEDPEHVRPGFCCAYTSYWRSAGMIFPVPRFLMEALAHYKMAFPQMHPSFVRHVIGCAVRAREEGVSFGVRDLRKLFSVKNNTRLPGSFYSSPRPNRRIFTNTPQRDSGWSDEMFFFRVSEATMGDFDFGRIRTEWATSVVVDPVPNNPGIDYLVERLGREKVNWSTFTPERIRRVLSSPPAPPPDRRKILAPLLLFLLSHADRKCPSSASQIPDRKGCQGASSGGSRVRAGEFVTAVEEAMASKPTAGSSALADQVVDQVDATAEGEVVPLPSTVHVSSDRTRSSDQGHSRQAPKRARSDDGETRSREGGPTASNGSGGKPPFYWQYENFQRLPRSGRRGGNSSHSAPLQARRMPAPVPEPDAVAARNMLVSRLESRIRDAPQQKELDQVKELVAKLTSDLSAANERVARQGELLKKHTSQEGRVKELETREADLLRQLSQNQEQMAALQKESSSALTQSLRLSRENQVLVAEKDNVARRANRAGRREMVAKHREVLESAKAKFEEKRVEGEKEGDQIELQSNIDLLTSLISGAINQEEELARLKGLEDEVAEAAKAAQVSDFSIGKFNLPVVSEDSVARMEIDPSTSIPVGLNPFGTNAEEKGSNEEEEKEDEEMTVED